MEREGMERRRVVRKTARERERVGERDGRGTKKLEMREGLEKRQGLKKKKIGEEGREGLCVLSKVSFVAEANC